MLLKWWPQPSRERNIETIYGVIVAQARQPVFYAEYGVPDTVEGRFDMIVLHLFLYVRRISGGADREAGIPLFNRFCADLDDNLREMGVGDLTVPKKMQKYAEAFYGRCAAYEKALATHDRDAVVFAIARNVFGLETPPMGARFLADYLFECADALASVDEAMLEHGQFAFPVPRRVADPGMAAG